MFFLCIYVSMWFKLLKQSFGFTIKNAELLHEVLKESFIIVRGN